MCRSALGCWQTRGGSQQCSWSAVCGRRRKKQGRKKPLFRSSQGAPLRAAPMLPHAHSRLSVPPGLFLSGKAVASIARRQRVSGSMSGGLLCLHRAELDDLRRFARCPPHLLFLLEGIGHVKGNKATHNCVVYRYPLRAASTNPVSRHSKFRSARSSTGSRDRREMFLRRHGSRTGNSRNLRDAINCFIESMAQ